MTGLQAILFDLDGTLLDIPISFFLDTMVRSMADHFGAEVPAERFREALFAAIEETAESPRDDGERKRDVFYRSFSRRTGLGAAAAEARFLDFYAHVFPRLKAHGAPVEGAAELVRSAARAGYRLALATNPIFPACAVLERLRWADIPAAPFSMIPSLEASRSCKPRAEFFLEVAHALGVAPSRCLMVGNDVELDLAAAEVGMRTFLADRWLVQRGPLRRAPDGRGDLRELRSALGLPNG